MPSPTSGPFDGARLNLIVWTEVNEQEEVPVAFRYDISAEQSFRTNVFRPKPNQGELRTASFGSVYAGKFEMIPESKLADIVWEDQPSCRVTTHVFFQTQSNEQF